MINTKTVDVLCPFRPKRPVTFIKPVLRKVGSYWAIGYRQPPSYGGEFLPVLAHDDLAIICANYEYVLSVIGAREVLCE